MYDLDKVMDFLGVFGYGEMPVVDGYVIEKCGWDVWSVARVGKEPCLLLTAIYSSCIIVDGKIFSSGRSCVVGQDAGLHLLRTVTADRAKSIGEDPLPYVKVSQVSESGSWPGPICDASCFGADYVMAPSSVAISPVDDKERYDMLPHWSRPADELAYYAELGLI